MSEDEQQLEELGREALRREHTMIDLVEDSDEPEITKWQGGKAPMPSVNQYDLMDDEEILDNDVLYKSDFKRALRCDEQYVEAGPDLNEYFAKFDLTEFQVIAMCRTYANYLAQKARSKLPEPLKKVKRVKIAKQ